jgi:hypothetical protein
MTPFRSIVRVLAPALGVFLLCGWLASGLHQHHGASEHHPCTVCTANHSPAVESLPVATPRAPTIHTEHHAAPPQPAPKSVANATAPSRAPPEA